MFEAPETLKAKVFDCMKLISEGNLADSSRIYQMYPIDTSLGFFDKAIEESPPSNIYIECKTMIAYFKNYGFSYKETKYFRHHYSTFDYGDDFQNQVNLYAIDFLILQHKQNLDKNKRLIFPEPQKLDGHRMAIGIIDDKEI